MREEEEKQKQLLQQGRDHHDAGNLRGAAEHYQRVLQSNPRNDTALYLLGCVLHQAGNSVQAVNLLQSAIAIGTNDCEHRNALATVLFALGRHTEAEASLREAIGIDSRAHFHLSLGNLLRKQGRFDEALTEFRTALHRGGGDESEIHHNLGVTETAAGNAEGGRRHFEHALRGNPANAPVLWALRRSLIAAALDHEASGHLDRAIEVQLEDPERLRKLGNALQDAGDFAGSLEAYRKSLRIDPSPAATWYAAGCAENSRQEYVGAIDCFENTLERQPGFVKARHNLARALYEVGHVDAAVGHLRVCSADREAAEVATLSHATLATVIPGASAEDNRAVLDMRRAWAKASLAEASRKAVAAKSPARAPRVTNGQVLRIGYLSSFFHGDNWMKPVWGLINQHDRSQVEVHLFSDSPRSTLGDAYAQQREDRFHDISGMNNDALRNLIAGAGIQVLIDLNGYSELERLPLFGQPVAPVAIGWFNMYATTGLPGFDYLIGDQQVIPADEESHYSERILRVSGSYLTFSVDYPVPPVAAAPPGRPSGSGLAFGSFCSQYKITPDVVAAWSSILRSSPGSSLLIKNGHLRSESLRQFVRGQFARHGVEGERLQLEGPSPHFDFLEAYGRIDVALDTFPYNGGTTTTEAIWQGVPVLTFAGDRWASRTSASILLAAGLGEFVASDLAEFVAMGSRLANSSGATQRLGQLRREMRQKLLDSPVCDTVGFAREMEQLYRTCWENASAAPSRFART